MTENTDGMTARDWLAKRRNAVFTADAPSLPTALDALEAVLELHVPDGEAMCRSCDYGTAYPCMTVTVITTALGVES